MFKFLVYFLALRPIFGEQLLLSGPSKLAGPSAGLGAAVYMGPGDITSGATAWWGLRAYSAAARGNNALNVCNPSDAACGDVATNIVTGSLPSSIVIGGHDCGAGDCTVKTLYDQTGANQCTPNVCDLTQAIIANRPLLTPNCINTTLWCMTWPSTGNLTSTTTASGLSQPYTSSVVAERTANFTTGMEVIGTQNSGSATFGRTAFNNSANTVFIYSGGLATVSGISDAAFHALQTVFNGNSSALYADGTNHGSLPGGTTALNSSFCLGCNGTTTSVLSVEGGFWAGDQSANFATMNTNQHTYWGF